jgi:hypothetical protein
VVAKVAHLVAAKEAENVNHTVVVKEVENVNHTVEKELPANAKLMEVENVNRL